MVDKGDEGSEGARATSLSLTWIAISHCPLRSHAEIAAVYATTLGSTHGSCFIVSNSSNACPTSPALAHAEIACSDGNGL